MKQTLLAAFGAVALALFAVPDNAEAHGRDRHHRHATTSVSAVFYPYGQFAYANNHHYRQGYDRHWKRHHRPHGYAYGYWRQHDRHHRNCR